MGLCKCPKKKVTNLFCFEHRVNVCENCLDSKTHQNCVVKSYLQWLQDSDYDPNCRLCGKMLSAEEAGPCIRLVCYDVFHWRCLDNFARQLPANTAPAGYTCPLCTAPIFPASNIASPVADKLKTAISTVNWARAGLGLPLIEESHPALPVAPSSQQTQLASSAASSTTHTQSLGASASSAVGAVHEEYPSGYPTSHSIPAQYHGAAGGDVAHSSVVSVDEAPPYVRPSEPYTYPRRMFEAGEEQSLNVSQDHDDDKYKRRPAMQWFSRWFKSTAGPKRKDPNAGAKRCAIMVILALLGFVTTIIIFSRLGRLATEDDPFLDPMANPNIKVKQQ